MSKNDAINRLNKGYIKNMDFGANKTTIKIIKEGAFGETYFGDIYSGVNGKWYKKL